MSQTRRLAAILAADMVGYSRLIGKGSTFQVFETIQMMLRRSLDERPTWAPTYRFLAACYAHLRPLDNARETVQRLEAITPVVVPSALLASPGVPSWTPAPN